MAKDAKKPGQKKLVPETNFGQEDSDVDENKNDSQENEMLNYIIDNANSMTRPVIYQDINLCEKKGLK